MYKVKIHLEALREIIKLDKKVQKRIKKHLKVLEEYPFHKRPGADIKKLKGLKGEPDLYRLRIGKYRAVYFIVRKTGWVTDFFRRGRGYREL